MSADTQTLATEFDSQSNGIEGYTEVGPRKMILPNRYRKFAEDIENFEVRDEDVFIVGFPKTGSRWTVEMVWLLLNNLDFNKASETLMRDRAPMLEFETLFEKFPFPPNYVQSLSRLENPRCIRTHLDWSLLPKAIKTGAKQPKLIVIFRGPEDTCTSYYHQVKAMEGYKGSWEEFCELFLQGKVLYGPFWKHVTGLWEQRHRPNVIFVRYNEMKRNLDGTIREVAAFLGKSLSEEDVVKMREHLSFGNLKQSKGFNLENLMKSNEYKVNPFVRSGTVGDHKNVMTPEVIEAFRIQTESYLTDSGLSFG